MSSRGEIIRAEHLGFKYAGSNKHAVLNADLSIGPGEFILLTGPSGCGKSTLCRCLNGLIPNFYQGELSGELTVKGTSTSTQLTSELSKTIGYVFQNPENQLFALTVEKDIAFGPENLGLDRGEIRKRVDLAMETTNTVALKNLAPYELSGGQQQRVALAGVLAMQPEVIVLDEPTSFLDPKTAEDVMTAAEELRHQQDVTILVVEHRLDLVARYAERVIVMDKGRIVADGGLEQTLDTQFDTLMALGVGVPRVSLLWSLLRRDGLVEGRVPTHVEEAADNLARRLDK